MNSLPRVTAHTEKIFAKGRKYQKDIHDISNKAQSERADAAENNGFSDFFIHIYVDHKSIAGIGAFFNHPQEHPRLLA